MKPLPHAQHLLSSRPGTGGQPTFQLILLDSRRKFLSSQKCLGVEAVCQQVKRLLANEVVATLSIRRLISKRTQK